MTPREWEVLTALAYFGSVNRAKPHLGIARDTIHNHLRHVYAVLGATSLTHAVWLAWRKGLAARYEDLERQLSAPASGDPSLSVGESRGIDSAAKTRRAHFRRAA